jgi:hypothetical protein
MMLSCAPQEHSIDEWAQIVRGEYEESPGLSLTRDQVKRLWSMEPPTCDAVLQHLTTRGFLRRNARGMFVRDDGWF